MENIGKNLRSKEDHTRPGKGQGLAKAPEADDQKRYSPDEHWYVCSQCGRRIVQDSARATVQGQHRHIFSNPSGIVFEIACFRTAVGFSFSGPYATDFTWFSGYAWRIVVCSHCLAHLGWMFSGGDGGLFFGFITDRVVAESFFP